MEAECQSAVDRAREVFALVARRDSLDIRASEPLFQGLVEVVREHASCVEALEDEFVRQLDNLVGDMVPAFQYCMHTLQLPGVRDEVTLRLARICEYVNADDPAEGDRLKLTYGEHAVDPRLMGPLGWILESFEADWADRDLFESLGSAD